MVGIARALARHLVLFQTDALAIDQNAHQFSNGDRGMRIVQLENACSGNSDKSASSCLNAAIASCIVALLRKILLLEPELLPAQVVVGVQYLRDRFRIDLVLHGLDIVAVLEIVEAAKMALCSALPEPSGACPLSRYRNRHIARTRHDHFTVVRVTLVAGGGTLTVETDFSARAGQSAG